MRTLVLLSVACLLTVLNFVPASVASHRDPQVNDASTQVAARYYYRARRGSIFRR